MPNDFHHRTRPIHPAPTPTGRLPGGFSAVTGTFDHWTLQAERGTGDNPNHIYVWVAIPAGPYAGKYEAAVNVHSEDGAAGNLALLQYLQVNESVAQADWPALGWEHASLAYQTLGLKEEQFTVVTTGDLRSLVVSYATSCQQFTVYGTDYPDGTGLHDVHLNSGNPAGRFGNKVNQDGALAFFFDAAHGGPVVRWIYLKFQSQTL